MVLKNKQINIRKQNNKFNKGLKIQYDYFRIDRGIYLSLYCRQVSFVLFWVSIHVQFSNLKKSP